ncbi:hypothetical protein ZOD2009_13646 [Haladaptatus paucihalophilus DX253]|uniref:DUF7350 domain-containing protein n=1 Tax=Haladaptatus paucihalophilus DX253 TaxID=797209 RepID=E7QV93_HALPU|nr:iron transporter [Haladaptatus paucihalophilus]EFW91611.1 hypothetical protein ZOD2009_13646 [Haladaptatus paucihalophilus DX253]SHL22984.1 hypothetical protein SAMN05444342_3352 [Haladaptatus paucihalophilus DX253]
MNRRSVLRTAGVLGVSSLAGCSGLFETRTMARAPPLVKNRPDAVYIPTHKEGMEMAGMAKQGRYRLALFYSYPHRFWLMGGGTAKQEKKVTIKDADDLHLMASVWDSKTKTVLPTGNVQAELSNGDWSDRRSLWPMLSQNMGFHFGDNIGLNGEGKYTAKIRVSGLDVRRTGALAGQFGDGATLTTEFEFDTDTVEQISYEKLDGRKGQKDAIQPMEMNMPMSHVPQKSDLPGRLVGEESSGDAKFPVTAVENSDFAEDTYLLVSPRTPYRRYPIPNMSLSATLKRDGEAVFDDALNATLDPDVGLHYGANVPSVRTGDELTVRVDSPPIVSRHEGYETAFLKMPKMQFSV